MLQAEVDTGWRKTPILEAELGADGDAPFVLFSGHHDTWYYGVMDNGSANATMLEVARLCVAQRERWQRGLRLCFWSGHSHGRYSGSTWYVDEHWDELDRRCVAHINVNSTGAEGADILENVGSMSELGALAAEAIEAQAGQTTARQAHEPWRGPVVQRRRAAGDLWRSQRTACRRRSARIAGGGTRRTIWQSISARTTLCATREFTCMRCGGC